MKPRRGGLIRRIWRAAGSGVAVAGATIVALVLLAASVFLFAAAFFSTGCAFTERVVDRAILSSPEMRFHDLDPDRDLPGGGFGGGAGGGGAGAC